MDIKLFDYMQSRINAYAFMQGYISSTLRAVADGIYTASEGIAKIKNAQAECEQKLAEISSLNGVESVSEVAA